MPLRMVVRLRPTGGPACHPLVSLCLLGFALASTAIAQDASFDECEVRVREHPGDLASFECFAQLPRKNNRWEEAVRRLDAHLARDPANHLARFALGGLESSRAQDRAEPLLREAAEGLSRQGRRVEEVRARLTLSVFLQIRGRDDDSEAELVRAAQVAEGSGDRVLQARVWNVQGRQASRRGDYGRSWQLFKQSEAVIFPDGPPAMQAFCLSMLGFLSAALDRPQQALAYYRREIEVLRSSGDRWSEARAWVNVATQATNLWERGELPREEALASARQALDTALAVSARDVVGWAHRNLGRLSLGPEAREHFEQALAASRAVKDVNGIGEGLRYLAYSLAADGTDPARAERLLKEALALGRRTADPEEIASTRVVRGTLRLEAGRQEAAVAEFAAAFDAIESLRDRQPDELVRARVFSPWVFAYQRLAGALLESGQPAPAGLAFEVVERMRARVLLESLDMARATARLAPQVPARRQRAAALEGITRVHRLLVDPALPEAKREQALAELERLELAESTAREEMARADPSFAALRRPRPPSLAEIEAALAPDEALLSFLISSRGGRSAIHGDWGGGSWLLVHTRGATRVHALPDSRDLEAAVSIFIGLLARRDGSEAAAAARLHQELLAAALDGLPPRITRLVLVPDGVLHRLPFEALRADRSAAPLAMRYRVSIVPSVALWLRWRKEQVPRPQATALVLADPDLPGASGEASERAWALSQGARLGRLSHARSEGRSVVRALGGESRLLVGPEATERFVKKEDLRRFGILHFAAHAVLDEDNPERSAILLASGGEEEDGLLQTREVVGLDLGGQVVVLSACRSAAGTLVRGEGVMGLARAFFQAGARTVVGSLWPLRDDEAERIFRDFYRHLGEGRSVGAALAEARRDAIRAGNPAAAWAGLVVLGDGDVVPLPGARATPAPSWPSRWWLAPMAALGLAVALGALRRRARPV